MKPASFDLLQPINWKQALDGMKEFEEDAQILAGGQSLVAMLNMRIAKPKVLIDINTIKEENTIINSKDTIEISALYRQLELEKRKETKNDLPLIYEALPYIGHQQHRARGTIVGSLCHADPSSELPLCFIALKGILKLNSYKNERLVKAEDFFLGPLLTSRKQNEIVTSVVIPKAKKSTGYAFNEISEKYGDFALASFAVIAEEKKIRLVVGGVCEIPTAIEWSTHDLKELKDLLNDFAWDLETITDQYTSARYKRDLIRHTGLNTIKSAIDRIILN
jgi:2-furoyl-CoA dehydrogenase FAD binding subunit